MNKTVIFLAVLACIFWGSAFAGAKIGFEYMPPILLSGFRFVLAGLLLIPLLVYRKTPIVASIKQHWKFMSFFAFIQTFLQYGLFYMGLDKVPAVTASIIIGAGPLFVMIMAHFAMDNDKITPRKVISIVLALMGVLFISLTKGGESGVSEMFYVGIALLVASNLLGSYTYIIVAKHTNDISPILLTSFANFSGGLLLLLCGFFVESFPSEVLPVEFYLSLLWLAMIPAASFSIWYSLLQRPGVKISDLNMWKFVIPITGCILSWILLPEETPNIYSVSGIAVITLALQIYQMPLSRWHSIQRFFGFRRRDSKVS